jgi:hypothetical protein
MSVLSNKKARLKKVLQVLYPEYKYISVKNNLSVVTCTHRGILWGARLFTKKNRTSFNLLVSHYIPQRLVMLKYNNKEFLSVIVEDVTSVEMRKEDVVSYFYKEIIKIKYPHVFKEVAIPEVPYLSNLEPMEPTPTMEVKYRPTVVVTVTRSFHDHPLYYEIMLLCAISIVIIASLIINLWLKQ